VNSHHTTVAQHYNLVTGLDDMKAPEARFIDKFLQGSKLLKVTERTPNNTAVIYLLGTKHVLDVGASHRYRLLVSAPAAREESLRRQ